MYESRTRTTKQSINPIFTVIMLSTFSFNLNEITSGLKMYRTLILANPQMLLLLAWLAVPAMLAIDSVPPVAGVDKIYETQSYLILYNDAVNEEDAINCTLPLNITHTTQDALYQQRWAAPSGVPLVMRPEDVRADDRKTSSQAWVELTPDNSLVFHNPDSSVSGPYVCHTEANQKTIHQTKIWVHVMNKARFNTAERIQVAFIAATIFLVIVLLCIGAVWWHRRNRLNYEVSKTDDGHFDIQTMKPLTSAGEKA